MCGTKLNSKKERKEEGSFIFSTDALRYYIIVIKIKVLCIRYSMQACRMLQYSMVYTGTPGKRLNLRDFDKF
jgi:hypothetical protein